MNLDISDQGPQEGGLFLQVLKEEGIEEIYLEKIAAISKQPLTSKTTAVTASSDSSMSETAFSSSPNRPLMLKLHEEVQTCQRCAELVKNRTRIVFGAGNLEAKLLFVGEAPGQDEDLQGLPFVGAAGQLLTKIIQSIGLQRKDVFIANVLKCRPPQNRSPQPDEIAQCKSYLMRQIELIRPQIICCLGTFAAQTLLQTQSPISKLRGKFHDWNNAKLICTFHPAYLLRNPSEKRKVWEDMKAIKKELESQAS